MSKMEGARIAIPGPTGVAPRMGPRGSIMTTICLPPRAAPLGDPVLAGGAAGSLAPVLSSPPNMRESSEARSAIPPTACWRVPLVLFAVADRDDRSPRSELLEDRDERKD